MSATPRLSAVTVGPRPDGWPAVRVFAKRTYAVEAGRCAVAAEQVCLVEEPSPDDDLAVLRHDVDTMVNKAHVDVVVVGHAYPPRPMNAFEAAVRVGRLERRIAVFGERRCELVGGAIRFDAPAPVDRIPLRWERAYGGVDRVAQLAHQDRLVEVGRRSFPGVELDPRFGWFGYPRNPVGRGYLIEPNERAVARLELPNLEEPTRLLRPDNLALHEPRLWPNQPPVASTSWLPITFFPRIAQLGHPLVPFDRSRVPDEAFFEVSAGVLASEVLRPETPFERRLSLGFAQSAAVGMRLPALSGGERIELVNLHPRVPSFAFDLPARSPRLAVRIPGGAAIELTPRVGTLLLEPDRDRISVVFTAELPLDRPISSARAAAIEHAVTHVT